MLWECAYTRVPAEMGSIEIYVSAIRIARYFCTDIGIALATFKSIVYLYRFTHILRIADTALVAVKVFFNFSNFKIFLALLHSACSAVQVLFFESWSP